MPPKRGRKRKIVNKSDKVPSAKKIRKKDVAEPIQKQKKNEAVDDDIKDFKEKRHRRTHRKNNLMGKANTRDKQVVKENKKSRKVLDAISSSSEESESEWEEVEEIPVSVFPAEKIQEKETADDKSLEITVAIPGIKPKGKKKFDWLTYFKREMNRHAKQNNIALHKVNLLGLMANGLYTNSLCNSELLKAVALSLVPIHLSSLTMKKWSLALLTTFIIWFRKEFTIEQNIDGSTKEKIEPETELLASLDTKIVSSIEKFVHLCIVFLRSLGLDTRLLLSLQPIPFKPSTPAKAKANKKNPSKKQVKSSGTTSEYFEPAASTSRGLPAKSEESINQPGQTRRSSRNKKTPPPVKLGTDVLSESSDETVESSGSTSRYFPPKRGARRKPPVSGTRNNDSASSNPRVEDVATSDESDFEVTPAVVILKSRGKTQSKQTRAAKVKKQLDTPMIEETTPSNDERDLWIEVYMAKEKRWICLDPISGSIDQPKLCDQHATQPLHYVLAFDNDNSVKDVTSRYASAWLTLTQKLRIDSAWWQETLQPYQSLKTNRDKKENQQLQADLQQQPLPSSVAEYKNHPLYVLKRHLLKFEVIHPETARVMGYCRGEPVYPRSSVHTLHTKETWLKEGRFVGLDEKPSKMVKARHYKNKAKYKDDLVPVYGLWQTEIYVPPPVVDGKIPRNEYGNVELFKPWMLPKGTVHVQIQGLNKVARKLNLECVGAMVGWDFHGGYCHAILDGWIVLEENKDVLLSAWEEYQQEMEKKQREKKMKKVLDNWKLLTKGLLIRERLKMRFETAPNCGSDDQNAVVDQAMAWPANKGVATTEKSHLFPFEKM